MRRKRPSRIHRPRFKNVAPHSESATQESNPMVDPDYLIIERDPQKLHAYARALLNRLLHPSPRYPLEMVKAAAVWLVGAYIDARVSLVQEMYSLIFGIVERNPKASTFRMVQEKNEDAYWAAIRFESVRPTDPTGKAPSTATLYAVAKHVLHGVGFPQQGMRKSKIKDSERAPDAAQKSAEATIRGWRKSDHYRRNVRFQRDSAAGLREMPDSFRSME